MTLPKELREKARAHVDELGSAEEFNKYNSYDVNLEEEAFLEGVEWLYGEPTHGLAQLLHCYELLDKRREELEAKLKAAEEKATKWRTEYNLLVASLPND